MNKLESNSTFGCDGQRLKDKVAIVTGGARGIGAETAKLFALNGAYVVLADILDELGTSVAATIGGRYIHCDVSKEDDVESAVKLALAWKGRLDIIFNNAGIPGPNGSIANIRMDQLSNTLAINLYGMVHGIKHASRAMIEDKRGGSIICTTSSATLMGGLASHAYTISKNAILGLVKSAACELGAHGIRVNCVSPHGVPSEMLICAYREFLGDVDIDEVVKITKEKASLIRGRGGRFEDVAAGALFLAGEEAGFLTGHNLVIDGGYTAGTTGLSHMYRD